MSPRPSGKARAWNAAEGHRVNPQPSPVKGFQMATNVKDVSLRLWRLIVTVASPVVAGSIAFLAYYAFTYRCNSVYASVRLSPIELNWTGLQVITWREMLV